MKSFKNALLAAAVVMVPGAAMAADLPPMQEPVPEVYEPAGGWYLRGDVGWSFLDWNGGRNDDAITGGLGVGYKWNQWFRTDIRGDYSGKYNVGGGRDMSSITLLGNAYLDIPTGSFITPYVGAGAGWGWLSDHPGSDDDGFTYALMGGLTFDVSQNMAVDLGYRFRAITVKGSDPVDHSVTVGLRFMF